MQGDRPDIGTLLGGGVALLRRRTGAVLIWTLIYFAGIAGVNLMFRQITSIDPSGNTGAFSLLIVGLLLSLVTPVLLTAAMRAVLRPGQSEFAALDASMDELRVIGLVLLLGIAYSVIGWLVTLVLGSAVLALASAGAGVVAVILAITLPQVLFGCLFARLFLAFPLVLIRKRIALDEAWQLSRGHFWPFFLTSAIIVLGMMLLGFAILAATDWASFAAMFGAAPDPSGFAHLIRIAGPLDALLAFSWLLGAAQGTLGIVLMAGAMATAGRILVADGDGLAKTFS